jgi:hypothetical protein
MFIWINIITYNMYLYKELGIMTLEAQAKL